MTPEKRDGFNPRAFILYNCGLTKKHFGSITMVDLGMQ